MKYLTLVLISLSFLAACGEKASAEPFFDGDFSGTYRVLIDNAPSGDEIDLSMNLSTGTLKNKRYTFSGTATLDGTSYTVTGEEDANDFLTYIDTQAIPPMGNANLQLKDDDDVTQFSICTSIGYGSIAETTLREVPMWQGDCDVAEPGEPFAEATVTKN
mgnify:CR=1 FL=1